jgi:hypothetical protein
VGGTPLPFRRILDNLLLVARERPIVIQSLFPTIEGVGPDDAQIAAWVGRMREIVVHGGRIGHVQVYTVARAPSDPRCGPLDAARLEAIAAAARAASLDAAVHA